MGITRFTISCCIQLKYARVWRKKYKNSKNYGSSLIINETCYSVVLKSLMYLWNQLDRYTTHLLLKRIEIY